MIIRFIAQNRMIIAGVALSRTDVMNAAVRTKVVPMDKVGGQRVGLAPSQLNIDFLPFRHPIYSLIEDEISEEAQKPIQATTPQEERSTCES
jgi:hypothetical protein